jgi:hypothetical protein
MSAGSGAHESEMHAQRLLWGQESPRDRKKESDRCCDEMLVGARADERINIKRIRLRGSAREREKVY